MNYASPVSLRTFVKRGLEARFDGRWHRVTARREVVGLGAGASDAPVMVAVDGAFFHPDEQGGWAAALCQVAAGGVTGAGGERREGTK